MNKYFAGAFASVGAICNREWVLPGTRLVQAVGAICNRECPFVGEQFAITNRSHNTPVTGDNF